jgi:pSer/pThr/pTyr-binding forkhead associated (FHA) protein
LARSGRAQGALDGRELRIGKAPANHLRITDPTVSRFHCVVEYTPRGLLLRDLGSTNGTTVDGQPARGEPLRAGALLSFGGIEATIRRVGAEAAPNAARA